MSTLHEQKSDHTSSGEAINIPAPASHRDNRGEGEDNPGPKLHVHTFSSTNGYSLWYPFTLISCVLRESQAQCVIVQWQSSVHPIGCAQGQQQMCELNSRHVPHRIEKLNIVHCWVSLLVLELDSPVTLRTNLFLLGHCLFVLLLFFTCITLSWYFVLFSHNHCSFGLFFLLLHFLLVKSDIQGDQYQNVHVVQRVSHQKLFFFNISLFGCFQCFLVWPLKYSTLFG